MEITGFQVQGRRGAWIVVLVNGEPWAMLDAETVVREGLGRGQKLDSRRRAAILAADEAIRARKSAAGSIARSPKTAREAEVYLRGRKFSEPAIAAALAMLRASGTIDDERVIEKSVARRRRHGDLGPARLAAELRARGVDSGEAGRRARQAVEGVDLAAECLAVARRLAARYAPLSEPRKRLNLATALLRRGYESDHVRTAVARLAGEHGAGDVDDG